MTVDEKKVAGDKSQMSTSTDEIYEISIEKTIDDESGDETPFIG